MNKFKSHFVFSKSQRNGIIFLLLILFLVIGFRWVYSSYLYQPDTYHFSDEETKAIQTEIDSLKKVEEKANKPKIYPFNPNYLKDFKAYQLGMTTAEYDRLAEFRSKDQWINSAEDFQEVTQVSDSLLKEIETYFKFPDWVIQQEKQKKSQPKKTQLTYAEKKNLNKVSAEELTQISGVGKVLSKRIIRFRDKIGGFVGDIQLKDIYGLDYETRNKITAMYTTKLDQPVERIDINSASLIQLSEIPYFDYELAREIRNFVKLREGISSFEDLAKIQDFPSYKIDRIQLYLKID
ncbi:MAG: ComEA family DNA-binding protein [Bacteroidota bacterium]